MDPQLIAFIQQLMGQHQAQAPTTAGPTNLTALLHSSYGQQGQPQQTQTQPQQPSQVGVDDLLNRSGGVDLNQIMQSLMQARQSTTGQGQPKNTGINGGSMPGAGNMDGLRAMLGYN